MLITAACSLFVNVLWVLPSLSSTWQINLQCTYSPLTRSHTHSLTRSHTHSPTYSLTRSHTHSLTRSHTHSPTYSLTHSLAHTLAHTHTHSHTHSHTHTLSLSMCMVLHQHGHGHSHGGGHGHSHGGGHGHSHGGGHGHSHGGGHGHSHGGGHGHSHGSGSHSHGARKHSILEDEKKTKDEAKEEEEGLRDGRTRRRRKRNFDFRNINVRAAFIHTIGDLVQSIGVIVAGYIIWFKVSLSPSVCVCVNLFISPPSAWVVFRWPYLYFPVLYSCVHLNTNCSQRCSVSTHGRSVSLLSITAPASCSSSSSAGAPRHIDYESVKQDLRKVPGVKHVHSVHIWSLTMSKTAIAAHLALGKDHSHSLTHSLPAHTEPGSISQDVLNNASEMLKKEHHFAHTTLQVEDYETDMEDCRRCSSDGSTNWENILKS